MPQIDKDHVNVEVQALGADATPAVFTQSEYMRRMKDMSKYQSGMAFYGQMPDTYTLVLNSDNDIVKKILADTTSATEADIKPIMAEIRSLKAQEQVLENEKKDKKPEEVTDDEKKQLEDTRKSISEQEAKKDGVITSFAAKNDTVHQLIDLALLQNGMLKGAALDKFLKRSVDLLK